VTLKEAAGFLKIGAVNVTVWSSFMEEFSDSASELRQGHMWAIEEHKLADEEACARAQESLKAFGWTGYLTPAGKGPKGHPSGGVGWI
jgi:hypothetical protein